MGRGGETFGKKEKEKKRAKKQQEKAEKMQERKANVKKGKSLEEMMVYLDENGNLSSTPPDPKKRKEIKLEDVQIGVQKPVDDEDPVRTGIVTMFKDDKGYGFIRDLKSGESIFVHANQLSEPLKENNKVSFEVEQGAKGLSAVNVKKI